MAPGGTTSVQVALRIRPTTEHDATSIPSRFQREVIHATSSTSVGVEQAGQQKKQSFNFDQVHGQPTTQHALFTSTAQPLTAKFLEGFNCTILAYGQTSSGKTFTMTGSDLDADPADPGNNMGIIPRAIATIFKQANKLKQDRAGSWNYSVKGSFIEIYNEDLLDLLDDPNTRREVQIREDKDGHIIWGGLKEVPVKNTQEVMSLIRKGTSIRRTNETDMNATSSRSHAIFSLTLVQKKYSGGGSPPSAPPTTGGRSPSRLVRPGSVYASAQSSRVGSPTFGRPGTPSFTAAMGRGGLRPSSALGHAGDKSFHGGHDDEPGEWITVVSKFHFVDLAGSERLKRTAAAGERVKEGISINSGLLALGNVISALGDPSRAKSGTNAHVPYRDSKLTRLLQDSLGGNAHTLMIACVSPVEYNVSETLNTLKYANRARNIKNSARINEKEDGWDDVEWLQGTVTRLRKEVKTLKDGGAIPSDTNVAVEGAGKKVLAQMTDLQNNYEDLREKFVERTEELTRLRRELGEKSRHSSGGSIGGMGKYEEIVGPVIEEYEKTISAMEAELTLNRAALRHTNEMVEEKEDELAQITERHSATELYVEELRSRVSKLSEREASTEAYIRDLEEKVKNYDETSMSSSESMGDLKREISKFKDAESSSAKYILDLEARLARSDESVLTLQQTVERLELESERRREEAEGLQARLLEFQQDQQGWRSDLEAREEKVRELEQKMLEWEERRKDAGEERERMNSMVERVEKARRSLQIELASPIDGQISFPTSDSKSSPGTPPSVEVNGTANAPDLGVEAQFRELQQTHTATLADLSSITVKYRDALREITDLAAQIQEAKLGPSSIATDSPTGERNLELPTPSTPSATTRMRRQPSRDGGMGGSSIGYIPPSGTGRSRGMHFFRHATSMESLHSRSLSHQSLSLSQELSSVHSRKTSFSGVGTTPTTSTNGYHQPTSSVSSSGSSGASRPNLSISLPPQSAPLNGESRTVVSLEKEIMRLQEVLREREREIEILEGKDVLGASEDSSPTSTTGVQKNKPSVVLPPIVTPDEEEEEEEATPLVNGAVAKKATTAPNGVHPDITGALSPNMVKQFDNIRNSLSLSNGVGISGLLTPEDEDRSVVSGGSEADANMERLNELMLSMAQKESHHKEVVDDLTNELSTVKKQFDDLTAVSRNQAENMSLELAALQDKHDDQLVTLEKLQLREEELLGLLEKEKVEHAASVDRFRAEHEQAISAKGGEVDDLLQKIKAEHESTLVGVQSELADASSKLEKAVQDHEAAFGSLKSEHQAEVTRLLAEAEQAQERAVAKTAAEQEELRKQEQAESAASQQRIEEEYYNALTKIRGDHAALLETLNAEHASNLERVKEEHASAIRAAEIARQGSLSESESASSAAIQQLQDEHLSALARRDESLKEQLESLRSDHARALSTRDEDHSIELEKLRAEHESLLLRIKEETRVETEKLKGEHATTKQSLTDELTKVQKDADGSLLGLKEQHAALLEEVEKGYLDAIAKTQADHATALAAAVKTAVDAAVAKAELDQQKQAKEHAEYIAALKAQHQQSITDVNNTIVALQEDHQSTLEATRQRSEKALAEEKAKLLKTLEDLREQHAGERETLIKDHEVLVKELETHKQAAELSRDEEIRTREQILLQKSSVIGDLEKQLVTTGEQRDILEVENVRLTGELEKTRTETSSLIQEASKRESLVVELERHRSVLADLQENLQKVKDEKDALQIEKNKVDVHVKELQAQLLRGPPPSSPPPTATRTPTRAPLPPVKLPPPTPPPAVPPPPAPRAGHVSIDTAPSTSSHTTSSSIVTASSSRESAGPDSPATSIGPMSTISTIDSKTLAKIEAQTKLLEEQETMIKTLNKQLTHCETDLQTHMDLVGTLETSLGDSEKNLRKARMHATELARERDSLNAKILALQNELTEARKEVANVRRSVVEEKQSLEQRLDEERRAKERARQQLDSRMDELQRRKSKFACL
ncbi:kinesin [Flagelloscypha sp. PMI_526]|nr:kinesin [Flagelloscypha sp. PMI_526]